MATDQRTPKTPATSETSLAALDRRFEALLFDWDGTAVPDRTADAGQVRAAVQRACALGLNLAVVTGMHVGNIDGQLVARPRGPGELHLLLNRGSEVFGVDTEGVTLIERRSASATEEQALDRSAATAVARFAEHGLHTEIVSQRLNRRKIDLIPTPEWDDPPKARIAELLVAVETRLHQHGLGGLGAAVELAESAALDAGCAEARVTSDAKHVEIGLTDKSDSARWYFDHLWQCGISPAQVLIVGDEFGALGGLPGSDSMLMVDASGGATVASVGIEPNGVPACVLAVGGGPAAFLRLLHHQIDLRRHGTLPIVAADPLWTLEVDDAEPTRERAHEAVLALSDGVLGTRGSLLASGRHSTPMVLMGGVYRHRGERSELQPAPQWNRLTLQHEPGRTRRVLDLHSGTLTQEQQGGFSALQFSSLASPGLGVLCATAPRHVLERSPALVLPAHLGVASLHEGGAVRIPVADGVIETAAIQAVAGDGEQGTLERVAAYVATSVDDTSKPALSVVKQARESGRERLLIDHRRAWAQRWAGCDVRVDGDPQLQLAIRLALFHLNGAAGDRGETLVGARGLSGSGYRGHVFWDADVFVLPFLAATHPAAARAMLEYRVRRLPAARAAAHALGRSGARFAWESAATGEDVTPLSVRDRDGRRVPIYTGQREEHIVADVAWAAGCYIDWTGDRAFREGPGRALIVETARYWASRAELDDTGKAHIRGVIGPDEYHESVDDNAYTNVMARWNLRRAYAETAGSDVDREERFAWQELADALIDGYDPATGIYEQFAGFLNLEPMIIADIAPQRPIAADLLLSPERVHQAQIVKQADTLMLHHMVPDEVAHGSLAPNLAFYEPRTAHSSSLSPGIHAALFARAGQMTKALQMLALTARIDLDDVSDSTAGGVHIAAMGSLWQAIAQGFLGARPRGDILELDPRLPQSWERLVLTMRFRNARVTVQVEKGQVEVKCGHPTLVSVAGAEPANVSESGYTWAR